MLCEFSLASETCKKILSIFLRKNTDVVKAHLVLDHSASLYICFDQLLHLDKLLRHVFVCWANMVNHYYPSHYKV